MFNCGSISGEKEYDSHISNPENPKSKSNEFDIYDSESKGRINPKVRLDNDLEIESLFSRKTDTETKILRQIDHELSSKFKGVDLKNVKGKIELYTKNEPCENCFSIINQFKEKYPEIELIIKYKYDYSVKKP